MIHDADSRIANARVMEDEREQEGEIMNEGGGNIE